MKIKQKPLISIGIIFKNEIRCIERCLKSLKPLREAVPCELVMADTGSDDGSREIAAKYADILFDFRWINDFSAARNAVMDRCSGKWYFSIDCDEWLDPDIQEMVMFITQKHNYNFFGVVIRNYKSPELNSGGHYMDSNACRLLRMSTGIRFHNAIHEGWETNGEPIILFKRTLLHHDGYLHSEGIDQTAKSERNMRILRQELEKAPGNLGFLLQAIESSYAFPDEQTSYIRQGVQGVIEKRDRWQKCGPAILRHAVIKALNKELPELNDWIALAKEMFPDSIVTRVDVNHIAMGNCWNLKDYSGCISHGEAYFNAVKDYENGNYNVNDITSSPLSFASTPWKQTARSTMADAYLYEGRFHDCAKILLAMVDSPLNVKQTEQALYTLILLHAYSGLDTSQLITNLWEQVNKPTSSAEKTQECVAIFKGTALRCFKKNYQCEEINGMDLRRPAYSLFIPLEGKSELGDAAAILAETNPNLLTQKLSKIGKLDGLPINALIHALDLGAVFPPPDKPMNLEEMDNLAECIAAADEKTVMNLALKPKTDTPSAICWNRALTFAAVRKIDWKDPGTGLGLARQFAEIEAKFLPLCYSPDVLNEDNLFILPPMHRFGWYMVQMFEAIDNVKFAGAARLLRKALETCNDMKPVVEFLSDQISLLEREHTIHAAPPELIEIAKQVRNILAQYPEDDPAVTQLKSSPVYQRIAWLIETPVQREYVQ